MDVWDQAIAALNGANDILSRYIIDSLGSRGAMEQPSTCYIPRYQQARCTEQLLSKKIVEYADCFGFHPREHALG